MAHYIPVIKYQMIKESSVKVENGRNFIHTSDDVHYIMQGQGMSLEDREHFKILLLNTKNRVVGIHTVSIGTLNSSVVHPREVFKPALLGGAAAIILVHNHPSGDPCPSPEDIEVTERLCEAGRLLGIEILDHVIIGDDCYSSLKQEGLML